MNRQRDVVILHNIKQDILAFCCCYLLRLFSLANLFGGFPMKPDLQKKIASDTKYFTAQPNSYNIQCVNANTHGIPNLP